MQVGRKVERYGGRYVVAFHRSYHSSNFINFWNEKIGAKKGVTIHPSLTMIRRHLERKIMITYFKKMRQFRPLLVLFTLQFK